MTSGVPPAGSVDGPTRDELDVGVVVVTFNSADVVTGLIASLEDGLDGVRWEAVFVDNASSDETVAKVDAAGYDVVDLEVNRGYAAAINRGLAHFRQARSVLVLNPDVELTPGSVDRMLSVLTDRRVGVVAPKMLLPDADSTLERSLRRDPSLSRTWGTALLGGRISRRFAAFSEEVSDRRCYETARDADWAVGAVLLIGRHCLDAVGDWDESFFLYSEEIDYCQRVRDAGFVVRYMPDAVVLHEGGGGAFQPRLRAMMVVNKVREFRRRHRQVVSWCFFAGILVHELTRAAMARRESWTAAVALVSPRRRPPEIGASTSVMPT